MVSRGSGCPVFAITRTNRPVSGPLCVDEAIVISNRGTAAAEAGCVAAAMRKAAARTPRRAKRSIDASMDGGIRPLSTHDAGLFYYVMPGRLTYP
jgi:hypothetical protein